MPCSNSEMTVFIGSICLWDSAHTYTCTQQTSWTGSPSWWTWQKHLHYIWNHTEMLTDCMKKINKLPCNMISLTKHASPQYITATSICSWQRGNRGCQMENILCWASVYGYTQMPLNFSKTLSSVSTTLAHWQALSTGLYLHTFI